MPHPVKKSSTLGTGCLLQFLGLMCFPVAFFTVFTVIGPFIFAPLGLWMIFKGGRLAYWVECSDCGTRLISKKVKVCPGCRGKME